jgi:hypothetical protein
MPDGVFASPRPVPESRVPALGGSVVILLALPVFLIASLPVTAWAIAFGLWVGYLGVGLLLQRLPLGTGNLAAAGVVAFVRMSRAAGLMAILIVVAVSDSDLGLPAAIVYALAFTVEFVLSLFVYFGGEEASS